MHSNLWVLHPFEPHPPRGISCKLPFPVLGSCEPPTSRRASARRRRGAEGSRRPEHFWTIASSLLDSHADETISLELSHSYTSALLVEFCSGHGSARKYQRSLIIIAARLSDCLLPLLSRLLVVELLAELSEHRLTSLASVSSREGVEREQKSTSLPVTPLPAELPKNGVLEKARNLEALRARACEGWAVPPGLRARAAYRPRGVRPSEPHQTVQHFFLPASVGAAQALDF